ncbi:hypothetical protein BKA62DRAFT_688599 [Auriculariales sp. MPI-PUGE-AT-0066]|nr:hypothetical protein BKA62DRAFT_688599 [Auriculariales sp. MPI-PUGE-AT-0066]
MSDKLSGGLYAHPLRHNSGDSAHSHESHSSHGHPNSQHGHGDQLHPTSNGGRRSAPPSRSSTMDSAGQHRSNSPNAYSDSDSHSPGPLSPPAPSSTYLSSRPTTPSQRGPSSSHSDDSLYGGANGAPNSNGLVCAHCRLPMTGQFVRALGTVYHLDCFRCQDCNVVVANKFFPIEGPDGRQVPLCERDYFRRLNLICAKCGQALRGSYITACNKKFHVEHFTCSVCPTEFGPHDSYYEHDNDVYCHLHFSTRFATKCVGCNSAILKQFVEINRNMKDECWHPECYMIHKFWNVKIATRRPTSPLPLPPPSSESFNGNADEPAQPTQPTYLEEEERETAQSLRERQAKMEHQVTRVWAVLSAFEESSAACISDMLRQVSGGQYLEAIRQAEKFILHVEVLFATIDDLEAHFAQHHAKGMSHVREARMLCRKTVDLFTLLSRTQDASAQASRKVGMTQELLSLVTGLAHYLKILIRIALTGALKLEREFGDSVAIDSFLDKLDRLTLEGGSPLTRRLIAGAVQDDNSRGRVPRVNDGTQGVIFGYKSLAPENAGDSPFGRGDNMVAQMKSPSDLCLGCNITVEEDCVRLGTHMRWHSQCVRCKLPGCDRAAAQPPIKEKAVVPQNDDKDGSGQQAKGSVITRRPPASVGEFLFESEGWSGEGPPPLTSTDAKVIAIFCLSHGHVQCHSGFQAVSRLEQYAFLLNVALRRLYLLLKRRGVMPATLVLADYDDRRSSTASYDSYRDSTDIMRLKTSVHLDRKLSSTARLPKRSTIVESPAGKIAHQTDVASAKAHNKSGAQPNQQQQQWAQQQQRQQLQQHPSSSGSSMALQSIASNDSSSTLTLPNTEAGQQHELRPAFARNNTRVVIQDDGPESPRPLEPEDRDPSAAGGLGGLGAIGMGFASGHLGPGGRRASSVLDEGLSLADIPQIIEVEQARVEQRSLPRQGVNPFLSDLSPLELQIVKTSALVMLYKSGLREQFDLEEVLELISIRRTGFWPGIFGKGGAQKPKKKGVFGVPLEYLVEREGVDSLLGASRTPLQIPSFIDDVISAMRQMDMSVEGIFRRNGNIRRLNDVAAAIDRDPSSVDLSTDNPVQLAALMKKFFRDLPDPLLTLKLHKLFCATQTLPNEDDRKKYLHLITILLPKPHRDTMEVLFVFLKWVANFAHIDELTGSKMDLTNLATVLCPNILYSKLGVGHDESFLAIRCVTQLLEQQDELWFVPDELLPILSDQEYFANGLEMKQRDFMKKVETYIKLKAGKIRPGEINMPTASNQATPMPTPGVDGPPLAGQRSDPQMSGRGRQNEPLRPPPPMRDRHANSLERTDSRNHGSQHGQEYAPQPTMSPPPHGVPHSYSHPPQGGQGPLSPRGAPVDQTPWHQQQQRPPMPWSNQQSATAISGPGRIPIPPPGQVPAGPATPTTRSRPLSWSRNGDMPPPAPSLNGSMMADSMHGNYGRP